MKHTVKVGFLVSYDYEMLYKSVPLVYSYSDLVVLAIDKDRNTWSGGKFNIDPSFFEWVRKYDTQNKIKIYEDAFYQEELSPMECETRERNLLAEFMGRSEGWHLQLDADEYFYNFKQFVKYVGGLDYKRKVIIYCTATILFKRVEDSFLIVRHKKGWNDLVPLATNHPYYEHARRIYTLDQLTFPGDIIHDAWARDEGKLLQKLKNWGHTRDFDVDEYYNFWKGISISTYRNVRDFHPLNKTLWSSLELVNEADLGKGTLSTWDIFKASLRARVHNSSLLNRLYKKIRR